MKRLFGLLLFFGVLVISCEKAPEEIAVESVSLSQQTVEMIIGQKVQLFATVSPSNATEQKVYWTSVDPDIAYVSDSGLVVAFAEGDVTIIASCGGRSVTCQVSVKKQVIDVSSISLNKNELVLTKGESERLYAIVKPDDASDKSVVWSTSDSSIATVDETGMVNAIERGSAIITATSGGCSAKCVITVNVPVQSVSLNATKKEMSIGEVFILTASVSPSNATNNTVEWSSSNASVASVDKDGKVTALAKGITIIIAKVGNQLATCEITVKTPVETVILDRTEVIMDRGTTTSLTATVKPDDASDKNVEWISSNASIASVDQSGKVTAIKQGSATITAKAGDMSAKCTITVVVPVERITLNHSNASITVGENVVLIATILPSDATDKTITWSCANTNIATVNQNGKVTAIAKGQTIVTAKAGDQSATCEITVFPPIESVTLNQSSIKLDKGQATTLVATVNPDDVLDKTVTWSSSKSSIASVSQDGVVTAIAGGEAVITASAGGKTAKCTVTVNVPVESIKLNYSNKSMALNDSFSLTATINPTDATDKTVTWYSDNPEIASVDNGVITALSTGQALITASCGNCQASCKVTVLEESQLDLAHKVTISLTGTGVTITGGHVYYQRQYTIYNKSITDIEVYQIGTSNTESLNKVIKAGQSVTHTLYFNYNVYPTVTIWFRHNGYEYQVSGGN